MTRCPRLAITLLIFGTMMALSLPQVSSGGTTDIIELVPGTAVLLSQSGSTSSTTSKTNIFSPSVYVDYKRFGGEPTVIVDRYPFQPGQFGATTTEFRDLIYVSAPQGFVYPGFSFFWKSDDGGRSFRVPLHLPAGKSVGQGKGGGDSHQVIGQVTHKVFFVDLPAQCVTLNTSDDLGENWVQDNLGCGLNPGTIDDRQWVEADETFPGSVPPTTGNVYISFINFSNLAAPTLSLARSTHDGALGSFATDSTCNTLTMSVPAFGAPDSDPTPCPDPADLRLWVAGPPVADKDGTATRPATHRVYIPFVRAHDAVFGGPPWDLYVAISADGGLTWTRQLVAHLGVHNPANIFPQMTSDTAGNLYYTWAQTQGADESPPALGGETDVYYTFSTNGGRSWAIPINLTGETGDSAVFPWMVAGDAGQVDLIYYKASTGLNPNVGFVDASGNPCDTCSIPNPSVWNVFFAQSQKALAGSPNFNSVQISDHPNHLGQICTQGLACSGDRDLLDFITVDVDHLGAAVATWTDDNNPRGDPRNKLARQLAGNSVFKNQPIDLMNSWPVRDHAVSDRSGDVYDAFGLPRGSCPGMDILAASTSRSGDLLTVSMTLNSAPTAAKAIDCSGPGPLDELPAATGGVWGVVFWAASNRANPDTNTSGPASGENFYIAYVDNPGDLNGHPSPHVEAGTVNNVNVLLTSTEFRFVQFGTLGGNCFTVPAPSPCTITMTTTLSTLGMKSGVGLYSITGISAYFFGSDTRVPGFRVVPGNSEQADATAALDDTGSGTTK